MSQMYTQMMGQGAPMYPQQQMYPQQMMQPQMMMQQQQTPQIDKQALAQAFAKFIDQAARTQQNQLTAYIYNRFTQNSYQNQEFQSAVNTVLAMYMLGMQTAPGQQPWQLQNNAVTDAYEITAIQELMKNPQMAQTLPPQTVSALVQNIPRLQQMVNQSFSQLQLPIVQLHVPGYQLQNQMQPQMQMLPGYNAQMQPQPGYVPYAPMPQQQMPQSNYNVLQQPQQFNTYTQQSNDNYGMSDARVQLPPRPVDGKYYGPAEIGGKDKSASNNGIQPMQVQQPGLSEARVTMPPPVPAYQTGVVQEFSTPNLQADMQAQAAMIPPSNIDFDSVMSEVEEEEHDAMFNIPKPDHEQLAINAGVDEPQSPYPSFASIFGAPGQGANLSQAAEQAMVPPPLEAQVPVTQQPVVVVEKASELSKDGLPDGWLYTEDLEVGEFLSLMRKAKRNRQQPVPMHYDRTYMTRLYRYNKDGAIEQRIVGVPMDRLRHDLSSLDDTTALEGAREQSALFTPLVVTALDAANKVVKEVDKDQVKVTEALKEKDIFVVSKPVTVSCRQEASILIAGRAGELQKLNTNKHGYEFYYREALVLQTVKNVNDVVLSDAIKPLTQRSRINNLMELSQALRTARESGVMGVQALDKLTTHMTNVLNDLLTHEYGYAGELLLTGKDNDGVPVRLEDELVEFVLYMDQSEDDREVLELIHKRWVPLRERLCIILTDDALKASQNILARRYASGDDLDGLLEATSNMMIALSAVSVTQLNRSTRDLKIDNKDQIFAVAQSDSPYLYSVLEGILERTGKHDVRYTKHRVVTTDGRFLNFVRGGLGNGSVFIVNFE
jgi:hypothetical protein